MCNNTLWETIENVGFHLVRNGMIETYSIWNLHGEQLDNASSSNATRVDNVEHIVDPNEQVMDIINDVFPFASTNINQEGEDDVPTPIESAEFEQYEQLLKKCQPRDIPGLQELFRSSGHYGANAWKNKVLWGGMKAFDRTFPEFAADPRNVRLRLATDGFNPYGVLNQHHSTWPIFVFSYNLPPWKCMKKEYMMMTVLIIEDPGRSIDVYLRPLVDELKDLWKNSVSTYDKSTGKMFTLRAAVMWAVNDFPAYAMVFGWSTKGYMACPVCKEDVTSGWHVGKVCYLGHRRWLPWDHEWRGKDKEFDGNIERRLRPREWSGDEILEQLNRLDFAPFGKTVSRTKPSTPLNWMHKSMFFELPYWSKLKLRHNLNVMHVEKNVFNTLMGTILDIEGKPKDIIKARPDLERMGIRRGLWMNRDNDKARRDLAFFSMKPNDKKDFLKFVSSVKFPDGYAYNIACCVNVDGGKFAGLKSHDCLYLCNAYFLWPDIHRLHHDIVQVLCKFEMIFPPAFLISMIHVMVHLPKKALLAGPVNYRWMYPIESFSKSWKKTVHNRAKLEGSIIEAWVQYESLTFYGMYLKYVETAFNRPQRNNDGAKKNTRGPCRQLKTAKVTWVTNSRINIGYDERHRAAATAELHSSLAHDIGHVVRAHCPIKWKSCKVMPDETRMETNYNLEDLDDESLTYVNRLFGERDKQWKSDLHHHFQTFDDLQVALHEGCPQELEGREDSWAWLCGHFQEGDYLKKAQANKGNRNKKTLLHHSGSRPFSYRMDARRREGSKFLEIDVFGNVYVRLGNELAESLHTTMVEKSQLVLQESASQLPPDTPLGYVDPPHDARFQILTETLDQTLRRRPGTYCRGMGNARRREPRARSSL
ncbi:unnamed protein product [Prunus armeniaca]